MTPTSTAYCHGSMIHVPVKTPNTQTTPGECKSGEISLQSNVKSNPLSFHHDSSVYHIASLKHSLNSLSWTRRWFLKVSILGASQKPRPWCCVVFVNSGEQGQQDSISWWTVFGKWKVPTTCKPLTGSVDPLTPISSGPWGELYVWDSWQDWVSFMLLRDGNELSTLGSDPSVLHTVQWPAQPTLVHRSPSSWTLENILRHQMSCLSDFCSHPIPEGPQKSQG